MNLPCEIQPFVTFAQRLRQSGMPISPDLVISFLAAIRLLGPASIEDVRRAGLAIFPITPDRRAIYEAVFRAVFFGLTVAAPARTAEEETDVAEMTGAEVAEELALDPDETGTEATRLDSANTRLVEALEADQLLARFTAMAGRRLPRRLSRRMETSGNGGRLDLRRTLRDCARFDGDFLHPAYVARKSVLRRVVLLVDISGSMSQSSGPALRLAHRLVQANPGAEAFSIGTRLTRLTPALRLRQADLALGRASTAIRDFDRGTRLGETLMGFLSVPNLAAKARGAWVVILSDGLERDDPALMVQATERLAGLSWRLSWLTPLGDEGPFRPETAALKAAQPFLDDLRGAPDLRALADHLLNPERVP